MKFKDFDFRIWDKETNAFVDNLAFLPKFKTDIGSCILAQDNGEWYSWDNTEKIEIELYTGFKDKNGSKIYEGDIVAHYNGGIEYYSKVVFNQDKGAFEFVCIEHPVIETFDKLANPNIGVVGNIHENKDS